ncbi:sigma-54-dependent transcriptional regulator [Pannonibacter phragmitetus]|uniref:sigma-54-dependent transcriptional regulator n=1 Tax=Pannonibacter phragmitetus TaxID=121719 RepID=UPI000F018616|nr:sigma-54 dependent transcriptional regulator [Pannonibacter phragmitetus]
MVAASGRILVVDDDPIQRRLLQEAITRFGYRVKLAENGAEALKIMTGVEGADIDLVVMDMVMPELDGLGALRQMRAQKIAVPVIMQTAHGGIDTVVNAMNAGAQDFVVKPVSAERLEVSIRNLMKVSALESEITRLHKRASGTLTFNEIITRSAAMERVLRLGQRAASSNIPILIEGESGVGKELIARAIQGTSDRKSRPFITVNCGAIPDNLVESILFGHEKGAFTGAVDKHVGKFQEAHGGTLFLDEVGELPMEVQVKLLRALQEGEIDPIGARRPVKVDFRLISATNRRLLDLVKEGGFREDLYYRLNVFPIWIPPLRDRIEDIPALARHFLARFAAEEGKPQVRGISAEALALLQAYTWPGNIRQLENTIFRAVVLCDGDQLVPEDFPQVAAALDHPLPVPELKAAPVNVSASSSPATSAAAAFSTSSPQGGQAMPPHHQAATSAPYGFLRSLDDGGHLRSLTAVEEEMIRTAISHYGGRMTEVAKRLGIGRSTLYRKLKDYGLEDSTDQQTGET